MCSLTIDGVTLEGDEFKFFQMYQCHPLNLQSGERGFYTGDGISLFDVLDIFL